MLDDLFIIILIANLMVGILLGMSSIGGFLLPLIYVGFLGLPLSDSLALSFLSFAVAGMIGSYSYWKAKNMDLKLALLISASSIPGAFIGVQLNVLIPEDVAKIVMYSFVLISGALLLMQRKSEGTDIKNDRSRVLENKVFILTLGFVMAAICSLTGAGGPILLVPLFTALGLNIRIAVGIGLFNSVIIALPSVFGYFQHADVENVSFLIIASLVGQVIGIFTGAHLSNKVKVDHLRIFVSSITILSASYMIITLFI